MKYKKQELLELSYENSNSWLISILGITVGLFIGLSTAQDSNIRKALTTLMIISSLILFISYIVQLFNYIKLRRYIKSKTE
mgnify:FL=1